MSNTWLNVRFGTHHLQILMLRDWRLSNWRRWFRWSHNEYQAAKRDNDPASWRWFELMECRWPW